GAWPRDKYGPPPRVRPVKRRQASGRSPVRVSHAGRELKLRVGPWCTPDRDRHLRAPVAEGPHGPRPLRGLRVSHVLLIRVPTFPPARRRLPPWLLLPPRVTAHVPQDGARVCLPH